MVSYCQTFRVYQTTLSAMNEGHSHCFTEVTGDILHVSLVRDVPLDRLLVLLVRDVQLDRLHVPLVRGVTPERLHAQ